MSPSLVQLDPTSPPSLLQPNAPAVGVIDLVLAGVFVLFGVRSLLTWLGREFDSGSGGGQILYALHATARIGLWFAFAGFFAGYALIDEPQNFKWYLFVPLGLAGLQLLTGVFLARSPPSPRGGGG